MTAPKTYTKLSFLERQVVHEALSQCGVKIEGQGYKYNEGCSDETVARQTLPEYRGDGPKAVGAHRCKYFGTLYKEPKPKAEAKSGGFAEFVERRITEREENVRTEIQQLRELVYALASACGEDPLALEKIVAEANAG